jgi:hypothetical protein
VFTSSEWLVNFMEKAAPGISILYFSAYFDLALRIHALGMNLTSKKKTQKNVEESPK